MRAEIAGINGGKGKKQRRGRGRWQEGRGGNWSQASTDQWQPPQPTNVNKGGKGKDEGKNSGGKRKVTSGAGGFAKRAKKSNKGK